MNAVSSSPPFEVLTCSWPRAVEQVGDRWASEPEWDAPLSPYRPQPRWKMIDAQPCWMIDWCSFHRSDLAYPVRTEMRGFHVIFRVRMLETGCFALWDDDGCIIKRRGVTIHDERSSHALRRHEMQVRAGDILDVAQWQRVGEWLWGGQMHGASRIAHDARSVLLPHIDSVRARLRAPAGPPLKFFTSGQTPLRAVTAVYSLILNGYSPSAVVLYGEHQWSHAARALFDEFLPFAERVSTSALLRNAHNLGGRRLADMAQSHWWVLKTCIALLESPDEFCLMDDDVIVLDTLEHALQKFQSYDLVFTPDQDLTHGYTNAWSSILGVVNLPVTGTFNAGLYWCRRAHDPRHLAACMGRMQSSRVPDFIWEQGFIAAAYAGRPAHQLSTQRYFFPLFDGLPGGVLGYDYATNPCNFASIHFGGSVGKPDDTAMRFLAPQVLSRCSAPSDSDRAQTAQLVGADAQPALVG